VPFMPLVGALLLGGCATPGVHPTAYSARVERVDIPWQDFYTPDEGRRPMTHLFLRVAPTAFGEAPTTLRVAVPGWYLAGIHGRIDDEVAFEFPGPLPRTGEVSFAELANWRVVPVR